MLYIYIFIAPFSPNKLLLLFLNQGLVITPFEDYEIHKALNQKTVMVNKIMVKS